MTVKYLSFIVLVIIALVTALNAQEPAPAGQDNALERCHLQVQVIRDGEKIVLVAKGFHSSLPAKGMGVISLKKLSGCGLESGRLVDVRRVEIKNSALETRFTYPRSSLMPGIYLAWLKKDSDMDHAENYFEPAVFTLSTLAETEKYYSRGSQDIYTFLTGIIDLYKDVRNFQNPPPNAKPDAEDPDVILKRINSQFKQFQQSEKKIIETVQESVHSESFGLLAAMMAEYSTVINSLVKKKPLDNQHLRPGEGDWSLPYNDINTQKVIRFFTDEMLLKTSLELKLIAAELKNLPDDPKQEIRANLIRGDIDLIKGMIQECPQTYAGVITGEKIKPSQNIIGQCDSLMTAFEQELKGQHQITWDEAKKNMLKKIESGLGN